MDLRYSGETDSEPFWVTAWDRVLVGVVVMEVERRFPLDPVSVGRARAFVFDALADTAVDGELVRLLTSELATNAVLHAECDFRVRLRTDASIVRVEVINSEPELLLAMREP